MKVYTVSDYRFRIWKCTHLSHGFPWSPVVSLVSRGLPAKEFVRGGTVTCPVVSRGLPWYPLVSRGPPWSPVFALDLPWFPSHGFCPWRRRHLFHGFLGRPWFTATDFVRGSAVPRLVVSRGPPWSPWVSRGFPATDFVSSHGFCP